MSDMARTVSSIGVSGSERWQKMRSMKSRPSRSSEPFTACMRYLRFKVFAMFGASWMPQKNLLEITNSWRCQPRVLTARPMIASD